MGIKSKQTVRCFLAHEFVGKDVLNLGCLHCRHIIPWAQRALSHVSSCGVAHLMSSIIGSQEFSSRVANHSQATVGCAPPDRAHH